MPKLQPKQIDWPGAGYDVDVAHTLSAAGWIYDPNGRRWAKGQHGISVEALGDTLERFPAFRERLLRAFRDGALGFDFEIEQNDRQSTKEDWSFRVGVRIVWPDAVTRLAKVAADG